MCLDMHVEKTSPNSKGYCSVAKWLSDKDEQYKKEFDELIANDSASTAALHRFFCDNSDFPIGLTSFKTHRNGWCSCGIKR